MADEEEEEEESCVSAGNEQWWDFAWQVIRKRSKLTASGGIAASYRDPPPLPEINYFREPPKFSRIQQRVNDDVFRMPLSRC